MVVYDWLYDVVKSVARQYAADTPHWSQLIFPFFLSTVFIVSRKLCEKHFFLTLALVFNLKNPRGQRREKFEVLDADLKAIQVNMFTGLEIRFPEDERTHIQKFCRSGSEVVDPFDPWFIHGYEMLCPHLTPGITFAFRLNGFRYSTCTTVIFVGNWVWMLTGNIVSTTWWYFMHYLQSCTFAYSTLTLEPWLWRTYLWWYNYPYQVVRINCWMYYMSSIAFSWSVIQSDMKMPPYLSPTLLSHFCIIVYMSISWLNGFYRVTIALMYVEDFTNLLREGTKLIKYLHCRIIYRMLLPVYIVVWIYTHLGFFQYWVLNSVYLESPETVRECTLQYVYGPLFIFMLAVRYYTAVLLLKGLCQ